MLVKLYDTYNLRRKQRQLETINRELLALPTELERQLAEAEKRHEEYVAWLHAEAARVEADMKEHVCRLSFEVRRLKDNQRVNVYA